MFLQEARLAAMLDQANIAQVHDIGETAGTFFFTMEYLHGEDLRRIMRKLAERGKRLPLQHAMHIAIDAAAGLHFAHEKKGPDGSPLGIVHRDMSPSNIVVTYDGGVKVVDFGVAKIAADPELSERYSLKGKLAYMSPSSSPRAPSIGAATCSRWASCSTRSPRGAAVQGAKRSRDHAHGARGKVAAVDVIPDYPPELEPIVMRTLEKHRRTVAISRRASCSSSSRRSRAIGDSRSRPPRSPTGWRRASDRSARSGTTLPAAASPAAAGAGCPGSGHPDRGSRRGHVIRPGGGVRVGRELRHADHPVAARATTRDAVVDAVGGCHRRRHRRAGGRGCAVVRPQPRGRAGGRRVGGRARHVGRHAGRRARRGGRRARHFRTRLLLPDPPPSAAAANRHGDCAAGGAGRRRAGAAASATWAAASGQSGRRFLGGADQAPGRASGAASQSLPRARRRPAARFRCASRSPPTDVSPRSPCYPRRSARRRSASVWPTSARARCSRRNPLPIAFRIPLMLERRVAQESDR